jgi:hypothetical protein
VVHLLDELRWSRFYKFILKSYKSNTDSAGADLVRLLKAMVMLRKIKVSRLLIRTAIVLLMGVLILLKYLHDIRELHLVYMP